MENHNLIFDIKRFAIHDGPGIRITIFLKGCPLSCEWCHNPEGQSRKAQKMYTESKCIGSQECVEVCEHEALSLTPEGIITDSNKCTLCGDCAEICPTKAIEMSGKSMTVREVMDIIKQEMLLIDQSGGGVTFSGGEPLFHHKFLIDLLDACREEGIHCCVDTTGFANTNIILEVAKRTDLFLYDLKLMNSDKHKRYTGVPNEKILENLKLLSETKVDFVIRIPLIQGVNDDDENLTMTAEYLASLPHKATKVQILPYHNISSNKHKKLNQEQNEKVHLTPGKIAQTRAIEIFEDYEIFAEIGG